MAPKLTEDERNHLGKSLEQLVSSIKKGMLVAGTDESTQRQFLRQLSEWHLNLIGKDKRGGSDAGKGAGMLDPSETVQLRAEDLRRSELLDMLEHADIQHIDVESR